MKRSIIRECECKKGRADIYIDPYISDDIIERLYCPLCEREEEIDINHLIEDDEWIIEHKGIERFSSGEEEREIDLFSNNLYGNIFQIYSYALNIGVEGNAELN